MEIAGVQWTSFLDFPGKVAAVFFTPGCNLDCYYCHNRILLGKRAHMAAYDTGDVLRRLAERRLFLEGMVVSGGEPTLQQGIVAFIRKVREIGYPVKLDTNGTRPEVLRRLLDAKLLSYVAMDVKAPQKKYSEICGVEVDMGAIEASAALLMDSGVAYEFRTTFAPVLTGADIAVIARWLRGARRYVIQQYRTPEPAGREDGRLALPPHPPEYIAAVTEGVRNMFVECAVRGIG